MKQLVISALLSMLVVSCSTTTAPPPAPVSLLYVQTASSGSFEPVAGKANTYRLVLNDVAPSTVYFSDRPNRMVGQIPTGEFLKRIGFGGDKNPNAAIEIEGAAADSDLIVVTLTRPAYDAASEALSYEVEILGTAGGDLAIFSNRLDQRLPARFGAVALFVDNNWCAAWNAGCVEGTNPCCPPMICKFMDPPPRQGYGQYFCEGKN